MSEQEKVSGRTIDISYRQAPNYRNVDAAGAYGGVTPTGEIFMGVYSQRVHFPESSVLELDSEGHPGEENFAVAKGIVREIEVGLTMDFDTAVAVHNWLAEKISVRVAMDQQRQTAKESK
jgi:hypothetical protein